MLDQKNEALERLMDGGDDASSANLFGTAINVETRQTPIPLAVPQTPKAPQIGKLKIGRVILCVMVLVLSVGAIAAQMFFVKFKSPVVRSPILVQKPVEVIKQNEPIPQKEVETMPAPSNEPIDLEALKKVLDQSIISKVKVVDTKSDMILEVPQKTPKIDLPPKQKLKTQNIRANTQIRKVVEPKIILPNYSGAASIENSAAIKSDNVAKQIQVAQIAPPTLVAGDKLSSGETVLSVSINGDIVTDMRIIKKGQK